MSKSLEYRLFKIFSVYPLVYLVTCFISSLIFKSYLLPKEYGFINSYIIHPWMHTGIIPLVLLLLMYSIHRYCVYLKVSLVGILALNLYKMYSYLITENVYVGYNILISIILVFLVGLYVSKLLKNKENE